MNQRQRYLLRFSSLQRWHFAPVGERDTRSADVYMSNVTKLMARGLIVGVLLAKTLRAAKSLGF